jgi:hypothetical protein
MASCLVAADNKSSGEPWEISGDLTEACSCAVPCTCNFGQGPSPQHYCWTVWGRAIEKGHYGSLSLDGLHLAAAHGSKSVVWYIDDVASPDQAQALKMIAKRLGWHDSDPTHFTSGQISQSVGEKSNKLEIAGKGGFEADYIMGLDGKNPVVVENNTTWNIARAIKGKTKRFHYEDEFGNRLDFAGVNSNQGKFDWTDTTQHYF